MGNPKIILGVLVAFALLLFGCAQPSTGGNAMATTQASYTFAVLSNNTTGTVSYALPGLLKYHDISYNYSGNWSDMLANVTLQGSIDNSNFVSLVSYSGNTTGVSFVSPYPVLYTRLLVTGWNASTNSSIANLTVTYGGTT